MAWDPRPIRLREIPMELDEEEDAVLSSLGAKLALGSSSLTYDDLTGGQSRRGRPLLQMNPRACAPMLQQQCWTQEGNYIALITVEASLKQSQQLSWFKTYARPNPKPERKS